jgi:hypothetical protein
MFKYVADYLNELKRELKGSDPALIQDALSDAEEHLRTALENLWEDNPDISEADALAHVIQKYGEPKEIASAYQEIESRTIPFLSPPRKQIQKTGLSRLYGVLVEPRAWGAFLYMFLSLLTGCVFGAWGLLGLTVSAFSLILIIGLPLSGIFLLSVRGIAVIEGRIIEALLGVRMPRKSLFVNKELGWTDKFKALITDSHTWKALLYVVLMFPLGLLYAAVIFLMFAFSLSFIMAPILELAFHIPLELFGWETFTPVWLLPLVSITGLILLPLTLHFARLVGNLHGRFAKFMLVRN